MEYRASEDEEDATGPSRAARRHADAAPSRRCSRLEAMDAPSAPVRLRQYELRFQTYWAHALPHAMWLGAVQDVLRGWEGSSRRSEQASAANCRASFLEGDIDEQGRVLKRLV